MARGRDAVLDELAAVPRRPGQLSPDDFEQDVNEVGSQSTILTRTADAVFALRDGRDHPLKLAIPAYETFQTDGTAGNTETFALSQSITQCPDTQDAAIWLDGSFYGSPDAIDYANDTFDVTDGGTGSTVHVYHISDEAATLKFYRRWPGGNTRDPVFTANLALVHQTNQSEQAEALSLDDLERFVATDMEFVVTVNAPYTIRFSEDSDGTEAVNALTQIETLEGQDDVEGLGGVLKNARD